MPEFPHPLSVETPAGCEGWEEMYPYWALFDERRKESDENRLWFWNSQHFPFPMPAFDMVEVDHPYYTLGGWQNRAFAVPPAMGVDYRVVNGYVYISPNPVTDPDKIAERAQYFEKRAGHYFENWDELYAGWRGEDGVAQPRGRGDRTCPTCPSTSPTRSCSASRTSATSTSCAPTPTRSAARR